MKSLAERLWARVDRGAPDECWPFQGFRNGAGYGQIGRGRRTEGLALTHRVALELQLGRPLRDGMHACHHCDNPPCCNPAHLYEGTPSDNVHDMVTRARTNNAKGTASWRAKYTDEQIRQMVGRVEAGETCAAVARDFGCAPAYVGQLRRGVTRRARELGYGEAS